jgi:adenylate cyclase
MRDVPAAARRLDAALEWAPSGRRAVPVLVVLVVVANLAGVATVGLLLLGLSTGAHDPAGGRTVIALTALAYLAVALPLGVLVGLRLQRPTAVWLATGRRPTPSDAARALRLPVDIALVAAVTWLGGAVLVGAVVSPFPLVGVRIGLAALLGGAVAAGVSYLLTLRMGRDVTARALQAHPRVHWASVSARDCC